MEFNFDVFASERIALDRAIPDTRSDRCKNELYMKDLPQVSVIIPFRHETNTTLLRTVHSVINRTPKALLKEVILVDDSSDMKELKKALDKYVNRYFNNVRIIRNSDVGADNSTSSILIFMDSRVEVNQNYLPPLIEPVVLDYKTVVSPTFDVVRRDTLEIVRSDEPSRGVFSWDMKFQRLPVQDLAQETEPFPTPVMTGSVFAISKKWWEETGKSDPGLNGYGGGEEYEIAFKTWQCGGRLVESPCSRIAQLDRRFSHQPHMVYSFLRLQNILRVASVWMDEYKDFVSERIPSMAHMNVENITAQIHLRERLNCKSFDWYMTKVAPDLVYNWPLIDPPLRAWGTIKTNASICLYSDDDSHIETPLRIQTCQEKSQNYDFTWKNKIQLLSDWSDKCFSSRKNVIFSSPCKQNDTSQEFAWNKTSGQIVSLETRLCLDARTDTQEVFMTKCEDNKKTQSWKFDYANDEECDTA